MAFDGTEGGAISLIEGAQMTAAFRGANPDGTIAHFFGRNILETILSQDGCVGIRMYYGLRADLSRELVLVGVDAEENDILDLVADISTPCPKACSDPNPLNN